MKQPQAHALLIHAYMQNGTQIGDNRRRTKGRKLKKKNHFIWKYNIETTVPHQLNK